MRRFASAGQLRSLIGKTIGPGEWKEIDQERISAFAEITGDRQWIHIDAGRAESGPFGVPVAHGYLMLSLVPCLVSDLYKFDFGSARVNYGCNRVRYPSPVLVDSRVRARASVADCVETEKGILVTMNVSVELRGVEKPGLVAETLTLIIP